MRRVLNMNIVKLTEHYAETKEQIEQFFRDNDKLIREYLELKMYTEKHIGDSARSWDFVEFVELDGDTFFFEGEEDSHCSCCSNDYHSVSLPTRLFTDTENVMKELREKDKKRKEKEQRDKERAQKAAETKRRKQWEKLNKEFGT